MKVDIVLIMIPGCVLMALIMFGFFVWANKTGQFEDMEGAKYRILYDDEPNSQPPAQS